MKKVKMLVDIPGQKVVAGDVIEVDTHTAETWFRQNNAEPVESESKAKKPTKAEAAKAKKAEEAAAKEAEEVEEAAAEAKDDEEDEDFKIKK